MNIRGGVVRISYSFYHTIALVQVIILTSPGRLYVSDRTVAGLLESDALPFRHLLVDVTTESYELERHTGKVNAVEVTR